MGSKGLKMWTGKLFFLLLLSYGVQTTHAQKATVSHLKVEHLERPELKVVNGIESVGNQESPGWPTKIRDANPVFGWELKGEQVRQAAYQIRLSDNKDSLMQNADLLWDSDWVGSSQSINAKYAGKALSPDTKYFWKVRVKYGRDSLTDWSEVGSFRTADQLHEKKTSYYPLVKTRETPRQVQNREGIIFVDFGKDAFGQLEFTLKSDKKKEIKIRLGEALNEEGSIQQNPGGTIRYAEYTVGLVPGLHTYTLQFVPDKKNTGPAAILMPDYIGEVLPFRYVEIEGYEGDLTENDLVRYMVHYPFNDEASFFQSSDTLLNKIWAFSKYSIKATSFIGLYVDGDRERIPYEADAYINQLSHYGVDKEYSMARRTLEYLLFHATWPTEWNLQAVLIAYNDFLYTGDLRFVERYYELLKNKLLLPLRSENGLLNTEAGNQSADLLESIHFDGEALKDIVDWPHTGAFGMEGNGEVDGFVFTPYNTVVNAFHYKALRDMEALAEALRKEGEAQGFKREAEKTYEAFQKLLWDKKKGRYRDGIGTDHSALHSNMFALAFDLVPENHKKEVIEYVKSRGMACSVYGSQFLLDAIYNANDGAYGLSLLTSRSDRSWYNMMREGSTITMEAWGNKYKPNQDWNHAWGAAPANIISRKLMGVEPLLPGWEKIQIKPQIGDLEFAEISVPTIKGTVHVACKKEKDNFEMTVELPGNISSNVILPFQNGEIKEVRMNGKIMVKKGKKKDLFEIVDLQSGKYELQIEL